MGTKIMQRSICFSLTLLLLAITSLIGRSAASQSHQGSSRDKSQLNHCNATTTIGECLVEEDLFEDFMMDSGNILAAAYHGKKIVYKAAGSRGAVADCGRLKYVSCLPKPNRKFIPRCNTYDRCRL